MNKVAVIGLGQMGATLAKLLLKAQIDVHVWNRTSAKVEPLKDAGAVATNDPAEAIRAADTIVMCVHDYAAAHDILASAGVKSALKGKLLLHLTTGSPQEAREMNALVRDLGAGYLDGAIQVAPEQMGQPETTILVSGSQDDYEGEGGRKVLDALGGNVVYLGNDAASAATMDLATLSYIYGASAGFFQGAALVQEEGLDMEAYSAIVEAMSPSFGSFLRHEGEVIRNGNFAISQSPLSISVDATRRIEQAMRSKGLRMELPSYMASLLREAEEAGYGNEEFAAVVKVLRAEAASA